MIRKDGALRSGKSIFMFLIPEMDHFSGSKGISLKVREG